MGNLAACLAGAEQPLPDFSLLEKRGQGCGTAGSVREEEEELKPPASLPPAHDPSGSAQLSSLSHGRGVARASLGNTSGEEGGWKGIKLPCLAPLPPELGPQLRSAQLSGCLHSREHGQSQPRHLLR